MFSRVRDAIADFWRRKGPRSRIEKLVVYGSMLGFAALVAVGLAFAVTAEDPIDVTFENSTQRTVVVYIDGYRQMILVPGQKHVDMVYWDEDTLVEALDLEGRVVFGVRLSRDEIDDLQRHVTIEGGHLPP